MYKFILILLTVPFFLFAQSSWKRTVEDNFTKVELFHSSKTANYPTTLNLEQGNFLFEISHRFGPINGGYDNFYGLDAVNMRISLGYGLTNDLMVTLGRSNVLANLDLALKYKLIEFESESMPSAISINAGSSLINKDQNEKVKTLNSDYMQYFGQVVYNIMFMDKKLGIGIVPSFVYNSYVFGVNENLNKKYTITLGTYYQYYFNRMWSVWAEYSPVLSGFKKYILNRENDAHNPIAMGIAIETGGHVFDLFITNSILLNPAQFLVGADKGTGSDAWHFAFGITREL